MVILVPCQPVIDMHASERKATYWRMTEILKSGFIQLLRRRLSLALGFLLFMVLVGGAVGTLSNYNLDLINGRSSALNHDVDVILSAMINQETGTRGYLSTANLIFLKPYYDGQQDYHNALVHLQGLLRQEAFAKGQQQLSLVDAKARAWSTTYAIPQIRLTQSRGSVVPLQAQRALEGKELFDSFRNEASRLRTLLDQHIAVLKTQSYQLNWGSFAATIFLMLLLIAVLWWYLRHIMFALADQFLRLRIVAARLTQGDFQARAPLKGYEELVQLGKTFNHMVDTLLQQRAALVESERQFRLLAETIPHMIWMASPQGVLQYCNQHWYDYTGLTLKQSQTWIELLHPEDRKRCREQWRDAMEMATPLEIEYRLRRATDGMYRWNMLQASPVIDQEGQVSRWFVIASDIEDRKQLKSLAEINQRQRIFVSTVSHEFRTSLTSIQGFSQLLSEEDLNTEETKDFAHDISEESLRLHRMIDDVLDLEKMREGKMSLHKAPIDMNALLCEAAEHMQAATKQQVIRCRLDESLPPLEADRDKLLRVVTNLLSNAIKYAPESGEILVSSGRELDMLHVSVLDHGIGISQEALPQIFTPFHRGDAETTSNVRGTGLGLPIVEQIVMQHGGKIWVDSVVGLGSVFHFTLPLTPAVISTESEQHPALVEAKSSNLPRFLQEEGFYNNYLHPKTSHN
jgi:PAS domain S-box-containing protein